MNRCEKEGWIKDFDWLEKFTPKYNREYVFEIAKKYKSKSDFRLHDYKVWEAAKRMKLVSEFTWLENNRTKFTYDVVYNIAKEFDSIEDFIKYKKGYYVSARWNGWLIDYTWMKDCPVIDENEISCTIEASRYISPSDFLMHNPNLYWYCLKNNWIESFKKNIWKKDER